MRPPTPAAHILDGSQVLHCPTRDDGMNIDPRHRHRDDLSVIHVTASVSDKRPADAALTILAAMGKRDDIRGGDRGHVSDNVAVLPLWLTAYRTRILILSAPHRWSPRLLNDTLRLIIAAGTTTILLTDQTHQIGVREATRGYLPIDININDLNEVAPHRQPEDATATAPDWSRLPLPTANWPTFRAECRDNLPPDQFDLINETYRAALHTTRQHLHDVPDRNEETTRELLVALIEPTTHRVFATTALRAAQAAHFEAGYNLRIDPAEVAAQMTMHRAVTFTAEDWHAIRAFRSPNRAAACVLYGHGLTIEQIELFTLTAADAAIQTATLNEQPLNNDAAAILRAARLERSLQDTGPDGALVNHNRPATILTHAAHDLGLMIATKPNERSKHTRDRWHYRLGYSLQEIGG